VNDLPESNGFASAALVELQDVAVGGTRAPGGSSVEDVTWTIRAGDYWVVGGSPGSGKSELLETIAGMLRPLRGTLRLFGLDRTHCAEAEWTAARRRIGLVFENGGRPFQHLTVAENIGFPLCYHQNRSPMEVRDRVDELLKFAGLESFAGCRPDEINHFQRQRLGLVRALALKPKALLVDNPLSGVAPQETRWWRQKLGRLADGEAVMAGEPVTLVVGCLDMRPWADQGRQFAVLKQRRWLQIGDRAALNCSEEPLLRELLTSDLITH
jgi:ABC-type transporter Mla maintaining outer membrane lipid asymmetry ATPase subunit MlaF